MPARKKAEKLKPTMDDRIAEYVDSPLMKCRIRQGSLLAATIQGNYGNYRTCADIGAEGVSGHCSCPSDYQPCKHVYALRRTWDDNPHSFFDLAAFLKGLKKQSNDYLINAIEQITIERPQTLKFFGVPGFEPDDDDDDEWSEDDEWE